MDLPDFDEAHDPDLLSKKLWAQVPKLIRNDVEQHVAYGFCCNWDDCYIGVLAAIAAVPVP